jgi:MYXO-CTERM domain-containing protein
MTLRTLVSLLAVTLFASPAQAEWTEQYSIFGNGNNIASVAAGSGMAAVATGVEQQMGSSSPLLLYTKDGGNTWGKAQPPGQFSLIIYTTMVDEKTVYAGGLGLYKSENGGSSYSQITVPGVGEFGFLSVSGVYAVDPVHAFAITENKVLWTPNGMQWDVTETGVGATFTAVYFLDFANGWVVGGESEEIVEEDPYTGEEKVVGHNYLPKGVVLKTTDAGHTFEPLVVASNDYFRQVTFVNQNIGLAVAGNNDKMVYIKRTTDSGKTWVDIDPPAPEDPAMLWMHLSKIVMLSPLEGYAAGIVGWEGADVDNMGNKAVVIKTSDGGTSWAYVPDAEGMGGYFDIDFAGPHHGWVVGTGGRIVAFTDGTPWEDPLVPDPDVISPDEDVTAGDEDVMSWGTVFGTFDDDATISANSAPTGFDGFVFPQEDGGGQGQCWEEKKSSGCSAGGTSTGESAVLLLLLAATLLLWRKRQTFRWDGWHLAGISLALLLLCPGCGSDETVTMCKDTGSLPAQPDIAAVEDAGADIDTPVGDFACTLKSDENPLNFSGSQGRNAVDNGFVVFVKGHEEGGSDLYLVAPEGGQAVALTRFEDPDVNVWFPSWSPDRNAVLFFSDYRGQYNKLRHNLFVIALDGSVCYQMTPGIETARVWTSAELTGTVTGKFMYGSGAIASPVADAMVAFPGVSKPGLTVASGDFSISVPPGDGTLYLRGEMNSMQVVGVADYSVEAGKTVTLDPTIGHVEALSDAGPIFWSSDGALAYAFIHDELDYLMAVDTATGETTHFLQKEEDTVVAFAPMPHGDLAVVAFKSAPAEYGLYSLAAPEEPQYTFTFDGQTEASFVAVSPLHFLASFDGDDLKLLGADKEGQIKQVTTTPQNLSGVVPGQFDWSLSGTEMVVTMGAGDTTNLLKIDVNTGQSVALTTDGRSSMPAWFGR